MNRIGRRIIVAWVSRGMLRPTGDDFAMLRLILLALLPADRWDTADGWAAP
jgi:hypothetical protein